MKTRTTQHTKMLSARFTALFLMLVSLSMLTISTATVTQDVPVFAVESTNYGVDQVATMVSMAVTAPDGTATYKVSFDVTPPTGSYIESGQLREGNASDLVTDWGVDGKTFKDGKWVESVSNIQIVDFNANGGTLQATDITAYFFKSVLIGVGQGVDKDAIAIAANGGDTTDIGYLTINPEVVDLFTATNSSDITTLTIGTGVSPDPTKNSWYIRSVTVEVSVDYLSVPAIPSTISFDGNGGSGTMNDQSATVNIPVTLNKSTYTREGYYIYAWANSATGTDFEAPDSASYTPLSSAVTLYAVWKELPAQAEALKLYDFDYSLIDGVSLSIGKYTGERQDTTASLYIPSTYVVGTEEYTVTEFGNDAFLNQKGLITDLLLPNTLVVMGQKSVQNCYIDSIVIPASVEVIGKWAFRASGRLTKVIFEEGSMIDSIGPESFKSCNLLVSIVLPSVRGAYDLVWYKDSVLMDGYVIDDFLATYTAEESTPASLNGNAQSKEFLIISPNPVAQSFTLNVVAISSCIYNLSGQCVKQFPTGTSQFDISSLDGGMYFIKVVEANGHTSIEQLIKK